jgi:hypothetical protein
MAQRIKTDVLQALDDWNAGKPVRSIELGHVHRMKEHPGGAPAVDYSVRLWNDQERAHAYCFYLLGKAVAEGVPDHHEQFLLWIVSGFYRRKFPDLTDEEAVAAESLAWKALIVGWARAIDGHREAHYIEVRRHSSSSPLTAGEVAAT